MQTIACKVLTSDIKKMENFVHLNLTLENLIYSDEECSWASL